MNPAWQTFWRVFGCFVAGVLFQLFVVFFSLIQIGAGHGESFCLEALTGPWRFLHTEVWFWPVFGVALGLGRFAWSRWVMVGLLVFHYSGIVWVWPPGRPELVWKHGALLIIVWGLAQFVIWAAMIRSFWLARRPSSS